MMLDKQWCPYFALCKEMKNRNCYLNYEKCKVFHEKEEFYTKADTLEEKIRVILKEYINFDLLAKEIAKHIKKWD